MVPHRTNKFKQVFRRMRELSTDSVECVNRSREHLGRCHWGFGKSHLPLQDSQTDARRRHRLLLLVLEKTHPLSSFSSTVEACLNAGLSQAPVRKLWFRIEATIICLCLFLVIRYMIQASSADVLWCFFMTNKASSVAALRAKGPEVTWEQAKPYAHMPGPKPLPLLGNTWRFIPFIGDFQIETIHKLTLRLFKEYGPIVKVGGLLGRPDMVFLYDADEIERVFRNEELMPHRPSMPSLNYYKHVLRKDFFGDLAGVIAVHGPEWYNFRTKVQQPMLQPRTAKLYVKTIEETADAFVQRSKKLRNEISEVPADYLNEIHKWSLESIAKIALDVRLGCLEDCPNPETQILIDAVVGFFERVPILELKVPFWKLFSTPTWKQYIKSLDTITNITMKHINSALNDLKSKNIKDVGAESSLVQRILAMDNDSKVASILALDMFLVGIDTTSTAVASILYQLSKHQDVQKELYNEIDMHLPKGTELTSQTLENMNYLKAVIKETLRMYPVVIGNGRTMTKDNVIGGYRIPKGVQIVFQHYAISNSDKYFREPLKFLPERWLKSGGDRESEQTKNFTSKLKTEDGCPATDLERSQFHPFASLPFGYGRRMCLGRRFAELEIQTVIAKMIQSFQIEYHYGELDYHIHPMCTPNGPLKFRLVEREKV